MNQGTAGIYIETENRKGIRNGGLNGGKN